MGLPSGQLARNYHVVNDFFLSRLLLIAASWVLVACGDDPAALVPESKMIAVPRGSYVVGASSAQRFPKYGSSNRRIRFVPGSSWARLTGSEFRSLNFAFGPDNIGECYLSEISGFLDGGLSNINRWRGQMGLSELTAEELAKLPRRPFAGGEAAFVKLDGTFSGGMGVEKAMTNYRMLAMILMLDCEAYSVKMVGPAFLLDREESEFLAFCDTLEILPDPDAEPYMQATVGPFEFLRPCDWEYYVPESEEAIRLPIGFVIGPNQEAKCEMGIAVDGDKASPILVVNQWREEDGLPPYSEDQFAALPEQVLMGSRGRWIEYEADGMTLFGVVSQLASGGHAPMTVIASLRGPTATVTSEKVLFRAFAETIRLRPAQPNGNAPH